MNKLFRLSVVNLALLASPAMADTLYLTNGNEIQGIVLSETPEKVELQFAHSGSITFAREEIREIRYSDSSGRDSLRTDWAEKQEQFLAELKRDEVFAAEQRAKGLILDGGEWVTKDEFAARTEREKALRDVLSPARQTDGGSTSLVGRGETVVVVAEAVGVPIIVSSISDGRRQFRRRHRDRGDKPKVRDWKNDEPGARDWRGEIPEPSIHQRAMTTIHNRYSFH